MQESYKKERYKQCEMKKGITQKKRDPGDTYLCDGTSPVKRKVDGYVRLS